MIFKIMICFPSAALRESIPRQIDKKSRVLKEEKGVWKDKLFFPLHSFSPPPVKLLSCVWKIPWRRKWQPIPVLLPGKFYGWRSLVGCSPWGHEESDTTERLHFHFPLSCIGEGNGNPLQCSCLKNPRDRGAWWAAVSGVAQSRTRLKRLSSSREYDW